MAQVNTETYHGECGIQQPPQACPPGVDKSDVTPSSCMKNNREENYYVIKGSNHNCNERLKRKDIGEGMRGQAKL